MSEKCDSDEKPEENQTSCNNIGEDDESKSKDKVVQFEVEEKVDGSECTTEAPRVRKKRSIYDGPEWLDANGEPIHL